MGRKRRKIDKTAMAEFLEFDGEQSDELMVTAFGELPVGALFFSDEEHFVKMSRKRSGEFVSNAICLEVDPLAGWLYDFDDDAMIEVWDPLAGVME